MVTDKEVDKLDKLEASEMTSQSPGPLIWGEAQSIWGLRPKIWSEYVYCVHCVEYPMDTTQRRFNWDVYYVDIRAFKGCNKRKWYLAEMRWLSHRIKKFGESKEKAWFLKRLKSYSFSWEDLNQSFKYDIWNLALFWRRRDYLTSRLSDQAILMEGISYYYDGPFFYNSCNIAESHISSIARTTSNPSSPFRISQVEMLSIFLVRTVLKQVSKVAPKPDGISLHSYFSREVTVFLRKIKRFLSCLFFLV